MKTALRVLGLVVMLDGLFSAALGHGFIRRLRTVAPSGLHFRIDPWERVPEPLFRLGALLQAAAGAHVLAHGRHP